MPAMKGLFLASILVLLGSAACYGDSAVGGCPHGEGVFLRDSKDPSVYYECSGGVAVRRECEGGLEWDHEMLACAFPAGLEARLPVGQCPPRDTNETVFLPDSNNCTVYYQCSNGRPIERQCAIGTEFNPAIDVCDDPLNFDCDAEVTRRPLTAVGTCPPPFGDDFPPTFLPDSANCTIYYYCFNGTAVENECWDGQEFNPATSWCEDPETFDCSLPVGTCPPGDSTTLLADSKNSARFYECANGVAFPRRCAAGTTFNPSLQACRADN